jgi:hypothetical protein
MIPSFDASQLSYRNKSIAGPEPEFFGINSDNDQTIVEAPSSSLKSAASYKSCTEKRERKPLMNKRNTDISFWTSWVAYLIYFWIWVALALHQLWLLYGILLVLTAQIMWVILIWLNYIGDDPQLWASINTLSFWAQRLYKESGEMLKSDTSTKKLVLGTFAVGASSGISPVKRYCREKMHQVRLDNVEQMTLHLQYYKNMPLKLKAKIHDGFGLAKD